MEKRNVEQAGPGTGRQSLMALGYFDAVAK